MIEKGSPIEGAQGKLGIMLVGLGAVSTTFVAGVELIKRGLAKPIGSLTQLGHIRLGKRTDKKNPFVKDFVPISKPPRPACSNRLILTRSRNPCNN